MGKIKVRSGNEWKNASVKRYDSSKKQWVKAKVYKYDSSKKQWVLLNEETKTTTFNAIWSQTYSSTVNDGKRTSFERGSDGMYQGSSGLSYDYWGMNKSLCGFGDLSSTLKGSSISKVQLYLKAKHFYYVAGGTIVIGYHNHSSKPSKFSHSEYGKKTVNFSSRTEGKWIDMPKAFGEGLRDEKYKGFSLYTTSESTKYYGEIAGVGSGNPPKLKITYVEN